MNIGTISKSKRKIDSKRNLHTHAEQNQQTKNTCITVYTSMDRTDYLQRFKFIVLSQVNCSHGLLMGPKFCKIFQDASDFLHLILDPLVR